MPRSLISWTDYTWNPFVGCNKVSPGCRNCYAERELQHRFKQNFKDIRRTKSYEVINSFESGSTVFVGSWTDIFHEGADELRTEVWETIRKRTDLVFLILTKRMDRVQGQLPAFFGELNHVWIGFSAEDSQHYLKRARHAVSLIREYPQLAERVFVSAEPILSQFDTVALTQFMLTDHFVPAWMILGGESGYLKAKKYNARKCQLEWIEKLVAWCKSQEIPVHVKQTGTQLSKKLGLKDRHGQDHSEWPVSIQHRDNPPREQAKQLTHQSILQPCQ